MIGVPDPFLYKLTGFVAELMRPAYPELMESVQRVARIVKDEEHRYATTFQVAEKVFHDEAKARGAAACCRAPVAFKLYDTYGLALDEQEEMAREYGLAIDRDGFDRRDGQAARARPRELEGRGEGADRAGLSGAARRKRRTKFLGYETLEAAAPRGRRWWWTSSRWMRSSRETRPKSCSIETPFYAEAGGQVGDKGALYNPRDRREAGARSRTRTRPCRAYRAPGDGARRRFARGDEVARAWSTRRCAAPPCATTRPRTCCTPRCARCSARTSSRRAAWWSPARLRFDFTHYAAMDAAELAEVERLVNEQILRDSAGLQPT